MNVLPTILSLVAVPCACPLKSSSALPITPLQKGRARATASGAPASTHTSCPASAMAGAPKTGHATKVAPAASMVAASLSVVSGWTVLQSTKSLEEAEAGSASAVAIVCSIAASSPTQVKIISALATASAMEVATWALSAGSVANERFRAGGGAVVDEHGCCVFAFLHEVFHHTSSHVTQAEPGNAWWGHCVLVEGIWILLLDVKDERCSKCWRSDDTSFGLICWEIEEEEKLNTWPGAFIMTMRCTSSVRSTEAEGSGRQCRKLS
nr:hypothetical protein CFP56_41337 [Quercus suber]